MWTSPKKTCWSPWDVGSRAGPIWRWPGAWPSRWAVCGSRPTVDCGWLPLSRQVGCAGLTVKPELYVALGISGAPEHVEGMRDAGLVVAINTDPRAPIFHFAHYGIAADVLEFLPVLTRVLESGKRLTHPTRSDRPRSGAREEYYDDTGGP